MIAEDNHTVKYFRAPKDSFWHWADNGSVIAWENGNTICYRDDLFGLLRQVNSGLPPLNPLLLLLSACARPLDVQDKFFLIKQAKEFAGNKDENPLHKTLDYAIKFLDIVAALPANLRTGNKRVHLIYEVFSGTSFTFSNRQMQDAIDELNSGRMDSQVFHIHTEKIAEGDFINSLLYFCTALQKYPTVQHLVTKLRTGLDHVPEPIPEALILAEPLSLYDQLLQDPQTAGLARLAKHLVAALNIPMQSKGSSDLPLGGISDITNRGNYDKLLLTELAHDDELLMARLVNNEALYFRREQPPQNPKMHRVILMDTTLKMWGTARVFALAAGLTCAQQHKHAELAGSYMLGGSSITPVSLKSKHGVVQALEMLDAALHCGPALETAITSSAETVNHEFIFITHARLLQQPDLYVHVSRVKQFISFIITVTDSGELHLYECINGISKLISQAKINVDELLTAPRRNNTDSKDIGLPAFITAKPPALYFPPVRIKTIREKMFISSGPLSEDIVVNETQRVLMTVDKSKALTELLPYIEKGTYCFGIDSNQDINILVSNTTIRLSKLYKVSYTDLQSTVQDLPIEAGFAEKAVFKNDKFYIESNTGAFIYDCIAGVVIDKKPFGAFADMIREYNTDNIRLFSKYDFRKFFDPYANIFYRVKSICADFTGRLMVGKHELLVGNTTHISFRERKNNQAITREAKCIKDDFTPLQNKKLVFSVWRWNDGSEAIVDPRGFLHLKSSDNTLPEITIVLVLGRATACWASDNSACGSDYYINQQKVNYKNADSFYNSYIQPFINRLS